MFFLDRYIQQGKVDFDEGGCWLWNRAKNQKGYGLVKFHGKMQPVHRLVLGEVLGRPVLKNMDTCHTCDTPSCVNPEHLYEGTRRQNVADSLNRKRFSSQVVSRAGSKNGFSVLAESDVKSIKKRLHNGETCRSISRDYPVSEKTISEIKRGRNWSHITI